ncbi:VWA domain-containing protein [Tropicimonas sp. TH_r6]|uniref:vWA domain-containing protein n=1 Tax=Tropicimonas sp. TH_r6 TaxID=3082085 RepID=UPI0029537177|nr:VWA domain-containing protein [Tropicimonas sp. TH_r6]MDV7145781.1 VWA domain-containing protein [Tropicimonas sp. TH_r6]
MSQTSRITRFAARDSGATARVAGFMAHLRGNGFHLGVAETETALRALAAVCAVDPEQARMALKSVCTGCEQDIAAFDALFDSYWMNAGRVRQRAEPTGAEGETRPGRNSRQPATGRSAGPGKLHAPEDDSEGEAASEGSGKLVASRIHQLMKKDLRELVSPEDIREAETVARRLGAALRDRRSRRRKAARKGETIDFRRTIRASIATGGDPMRLAHRRRPERPVRICVLCDVSGSMLPYARPFLAFVAGLMRSESGSDAYLFHTRLVRITEALREEDPLRALNRITLLAEGFGGGSKIGQTLEQFARSYARRFVDGRTVVFIFSDGYDSDAPERVGEALARLRRRGCRIVWLNPLKGWKDYTPVARGMASALPHLDLFAAANTLETLARLEPEIVKL